MRSREELPTGTIIDTYGDYTWIIVDHLGKDRNIIYEKQNTQKKTVYIEVFNSPVIGALDNPYSFNSKWDKITEKWRDEKNPIIPMNPAEIKEPVSRW